MDSGVLNETYITYRKLLEELINYMDKCQTVIGVDVVFSQILDRILAKGLSPSLSKPEGSPVIESKL